MPKIARCELRYLRHRHDNESEWLPRLFTRPEETQWQMDDRSTIRQIKLLRPKTDKYYDPATHYHMLSYKAKRAYQKRFKHQRQ